MGVFVGLVFFEGSMGGVFGVLDCWWRVGEDEELWVVDWRFGVCFGDEVLNDLFINVFILYCKSF